MILNVDFQSKQAGPTPLEDWRNTDLITTFISILVLCHIRQRLENIKQREKVLVERKRKPKEFSDRKN